MQPYDLEGSVDDRKRPLVRIETPGFTDPLVAFVDTGFNGALLIDERQAARLGFSVARDSIDRYDWRASAMKISWLAEVASLWLGERKTIIAHVLIETQASDARETHARPKKKS